MMGYVESKRCRNIRRVLIALFVVCGYMLSTTFAGAFVDVKGEETYVSMTALNLAFGSIENDIPVYQNKAVGSVYLIIPFIGFFFMFFDKKSNVKNLVGLALGVIGCSVIALPIGANNELYLGIGALVSMVAYMLIAMLSGVSIFMILEDRRAGESEKKLSKHL